MLINGKKVTPSRKDVGFNVLAPPLSSEPSLH
jgi:hypothetical protein